MDKNPIERLRETWAAQEQYYEPWTTGVVKLSGSELLLFFKHASGSSHHFRIGSITERDIDTLIDACSPATFGRGRVNVRDGSYHKAWKLDEDAFAWRFNPDSGRFVSRLAQGLCWDSFSKGIRVEPYKLNVYGKGEFFRTRKDTLHAENMFRSLVFTLPTRYEGGNLLLCHRSRELEFNAAALLQSTSSKCAAYAAFYSDVDHEVLEVTSGNRITKSLKVPKNPFTMTLWEVFRDAAFIRNYKFLGFGLEYKYPTKYTEGYTQWLLEKKSERTRRIFVPHAPRNGA